MNADLGGSRHSNTDSPINAMSANLRMSRSSAKLASAKPERNNTNTAVIAIGQKLTLSRGQYDRAIHHSQRSSEFQIPWSKGRHNTASTARIGYSATQENAYGATNPENRPPTMPPNDNAT